MHELAMDAGDEERAEFFRGFDEEVSKDYKEVCQENNQLGREQGQRREALGLPGGRLYIRKGTRCYWDYMEKGFYFWDED